MPNPLFNLTPKQNNPLNAVVQKFNQFRANYSGNPQQHIQQMLNSGQVSQQQYNQAVQMAKQLQQMLGNIL